MFKSVGKNVNLSKGWLPGFDFAVTSNMGWNFQNNAMSSQDVRFFFQHCCLY